MKSNGYSRVSDDSRLPLRRGTWALLGDLRLYQYEAWVPPTKGP
jgi:hypothetical protein